MLEFAGSAGQYVPVPSSDVHTDLVGHVSRSTGLPPGVAARVVADVVAYFAETPPDFVRRRHGELKRRGLTNDQIFRALTDELVHRRFAAPELSERQLRRLVYG